VRNSDAGGRSSCCAAHPNTGFIMCLSDVRRAGGRVNCRVGAGRPRVRQFETRTHLMSTLMRNWMPRNNLLQRACRIGVPMLLYGAASIASAQWAWRDEHGRTVYSDQPRRPISGRPTCCSSRRRRRSPPNRRMRRAASPNKRAAQPPPNSTASAAPRPPTTAEREQEFRKRIKEHADAEKKVADGQAQAAQKADDCQRARGYIKSLEDGVRCAHQTRTAARAADELSGRPKLSARARSSKTRCN